MSENHQIKYIEGDSLYLPEGEYCSLAQAAKETGLSRVTIRNRIVEGVIKGYRLANLGWLVHLESARDNAEFRKSGRKPKQEITA